MAGTDSSSWERVRSLATVRAADECWGWSGPTRADGTPVKRLGDYDCISPRRAAWEHYRGALNGDTVVVCDCGNKNCVNPFHASLAPGKVSRVVEEEVNVGSGYVSGRLLEYNLSLALQYLVVYPGWSDVQAIAAYLNIPDFAAKSILLPVLSHGIARGIIEERTTGRRSEYRATVARA